MRLDDQVATWDAVILALHAAEEKGKVDPEPLAAHVDIDKENSICFEVEGSDWTDVAAAFHSPNCTIEICDDVLAFGAERRRKIILMVFNWQIQGIDHLTLDSVR